MAEGKGVLVLGEIANSDLAPITRELLAAGQKLAQGLAEKVSVALLGQNVDGLSQEAIAYGADKVYAISDPALKEVRAEACAAVLVKLCQEIQPRIVLLGKTQLGIDVGPMLAFRLDAGLAQDCFEVRIDPQAKDLVANRPVYGGNAIATVKLSGAPQLATIRPKVYTPLQKDAARKGDVVSMQPRLEASVIKTKVVERVQQKAEGIRLEDARVVISGGRGVGGPEPFKQLEELAKLLGGAVGATRAACDAGWVPESMQIGLTGKTVSPDVYIPVGVSGASQHMAGCSGAKVIVAINKDPEANIFKEARYGVVGDWKKVLPSFISAVRELVKS